MVKLKDTSLLRSILNKDVIALIYIIFLILIILNQPEKWLMDLVIILKQNRIPVWLIHITSCLIKVGGCWINRMPVVILTQHPLACAEIVLLWYHQPNLLNWLSLEQKPQYYTFSIELPDRYITFTSMCFCIFFPSEGNNWHKNKLEIIYLLYLAKSGC